MKASAITDKALKTVAVPKKKKKKGLNLNRKRAMMGYLFVLPFIIGLITFCSTAGPVVHIQPE